VRLDVVHTNADKLLAIRVDEPPNAVNLFDMNEPRRVFGLRRASE
jgi:hypothetical protein